MDLDLPPIWDWDNFIIIQQFINASRTLFS